MNFKKKSGYSFSVDSILKDKSSFSQKSYRKISKHYGSMYPKYHVTEWTEVVDTIILYDSHEDMKKIRNK